MPTTKAATPESHDAAAVEAPACDEVASHPRTLAAAEARVRRKLDTHVLLLLCFLCQLTKSRTIFQRWALMYHNSLVGVLGSIKHRVGRGLTRSCARTAMRLTCVVNSNARIAGMEEDLGLSSDQYEWLLTIFYIAYILFEPLIIVFKVLPARTWIAILVLGWGIAATTQSAAQSWAGMMACRFFLAAFEAGFGPGAIYLLSFFYLRDELGLRIGIFFSCAPLATCFAGALAYGITSGHAGIANWRLLFLVEGAPVLVMAVVTYFAMPNSAHQAWFLNTEERSVALARQVKQVGKGARVGSLKWRETISILLDAKAWLTALMYFSCNVSYSSLPVFLPTILKDMGMKSVFAPLTPCSGHLLTCF